MPNPSYTVKDQSDIPGLFKWVMDMIQRGLEGGPVVVSVGREGRTLDQNARLWAVLTDVSTQVDWYGQKLTPDDWKHVFTAAMTKQRVVPGIDGGFVVCGLSTSKMSKAVFGDLLTIIDAFGAEQGVKWSDPALAVFAEYKEAKQ
jgi:hypothetical protein